MAGRCGRKHRRLDHATGWNSVANRRTLTHMIGRVAASGAVMLAAALTLALPASGAGGDVRMDVISTTPRPPQAARPFELVARVEFVPAPGSLHASVWIGDKRYRKIRLSWDGSIARCSFVVPAEAHGKRLTVALAATLGGSRTRTTLGFRIA